ncbi:FAD-binding oxidoreductase [Kribbella jiaozuonensis]|uniref:FAD-binding oxidoreductase n=1 Tax=Kribbella jiaozuonensis TaxID=2575441 RepID=A0A4U3LPQ2_9ACTN|nr:FAD-binding oxidoreductase [Kribbella jiaozuonensis]TKK76526.1 FAD-binding oxidoreductase [Kribbella jiaozuonensis]
MELIAPDHPQYDVLRRPALPHYRAIRPALIARCTSPADVAEALAYARTHALPFALRGGGHCFAGHSSTTGLLLELSGMNAITPGPTRSRPGDSRAEARTPGDLPREDLPRGDRRVTPAAPQLAAIGAGARLADVYRGLHEHGLTIPAGCGPTVGIAGLTLGGGLGLLGRRYGLTCDRLVGATVVLADGRVVECAQGREPDLFWALRGAGGGQFGVVTSLEFAAVPSPTATRFTITWPRTHAADVIAAWQTWAPDAPDTITASLAVTADEVRVFGATLAPFDSGLLTGEVELRNGLSWPDLKRSFSDEDTPGDSVIHSKSEFFSSPLPRDTIAQLLAAGCELSFTPMGGAYNRVPADAIAFAHRGERFLLEHTGTDQTAVRRSWSIAHQHASGRLYPNFPDPDLTDPTAYHGPNYERLLAIKQAYDPDHIFGGIR